MTKNLQATALRILRFSDTINLGGEGTFKMEE